MCCIGVPPADFFFHSQLPGPGSKIRRMMGGHKWRKQRGRGVGGFRVPFLRRQEIFPFLLEAVDLVRKGSYHTVWSVPSSSSCSCSHACGQGPAVGPQTGERCWPLLDGVWRAIALLMKPWCAEGEVPTFGEPEPLSGMEIVCWLALR